MESKILIVDDNPRNISVIVDALEPLGHTLLVARDGQRALTISEKNLPDLILLDVQMPGMDGYEVCTKLKDNKKLAEIPVLFLSAFSNIENKVKGFEVGGLDYIDKPFNIRELQARVTTHLDLARSKAEIQEQKREIEEEKSKSERLLHAILPYEVAEELKANGVFKPRMQEDVAILICDIVGFTPYCESHSPGEVVAGMQEMSDLLEDIAEKHEVEKINAIGDSFMAAAGLDGASENSLLNCVAFGLELNTQAEGLASGLKLRVGLHSGPVVVGVVGRKKFTVGLWGDTVNTAARMETNGRPGVVCVCEATWNQVSSHCEGESQGVVDIKGKGKMEIFYIHGLKA